MGRIETATAQRRNSKETVDENEKPVTLPTPQRSGQIFESSVLKYSKREEAKGELKSPGAENPGNGNSERLR